MTGSAPRPFGILVLHGRGASVFNKMDVIRNGRSVRMGEDGFERTSQRRAKTEDDLRRPSALIWPLIDPTPATVGRLPRPGHGTTVSAKKVARARCSSMTDRRSLTVELAGNADPPRQKVKV